MAKVSELRTESVSALSVALADPDERRGELGTDEGGGIEGERDMSVIDVSDVAVVMVGGEEGRDREEEEEEEEGVVVGYATGFKNCS